MKILAATGLIAGLAIILPPTAEAGVQIGLGVRVVDNRYNSRDTRRIGHDRGFDDGYNEGVKDARRGERYNFRDEGRFRDGAPGYRGNYGPRWEYVNGYRNGFESGYRRGYEASRPHHDRRYDDRNWR